MKHSWSLTTQYARQAHRKLGKSAKSYSFSKELQEKTHFTYTKLISPCICDNFQMITDITLKDSILKISYQRRRQGTELLPCFSGNILQGRYILLCLSKIKTAPCNEILHFIN